MTEWLASAMLVLGALFTLLAALGILRLPDTLSRMQAATKATTLGVGATMAAVALTFWDGGALLRALAVVLFLYVTAPVGAHALARAVWITEHPPEPRQRETREEQVEAPPSEVRR
jgi:multicomponent Na+:H+ antiporter subunit G